MSTKLKLYTAVAAYPNPQRLRLFLHEKGIADAVEEVLLDPSPVGEQRGWRHLNRNAWGEIPTLELPDGSFLSEANAIARYFDVSHDGRRILGSTAEEQALDAM